MSIALARVGEWWELRFRLAGGSRNPAVGYGFARYRNKEERKKKKKAIAPMAFVNGNDEDSGLSQGGSAQNYSITPW